ncbi:MAG: hypothetical protein QM796_18950 [Chthoniobacteraceae bacterium]
MLDYDDGEGLFTKRYVGVSEVLQVPGSKSSISNLKGSEQLKASGVQFPLGTSANYDPKDNSLTVIGGFELIDKVDAFLFQHKLKKQH